MERERLIVKRENRQIFTIPEVSPSMVILLDNVN